MQLIERSCRAGPHAVCWDHWTIHYLPTMQVLEMIGHNSSNNRSTLAPEKDRHGRGMNDTMQQQVLQLFKVGAWVNLLCVEHHAAAGAAAVQGGRVG